MPGFCETLQGGVSYTLGEGITTMLQATKLPDARKGKRSLIAFSTALRLIVCVGAIFSAISYDSSHAGVIVAHHHRWHVARVGPQSCFLMPDVVVALNALGPYCSSPRGPYRVAGSYYGHYWPSAYYVPYYGFYRPWGWSDIGRPWWW